MKESRGKYRLRRVLPNMSEGSFARNLSFASGRSLVMVIAQLVFTPIIVKLYDPEAYGAFGVLLASGTMISAFVTLQYDKALFLAHDEEEIHHLRTVSYGLPLIAAIVMTIAILLVKDPILSLFNARVLGDWILVLPLLVVTFSWAQTSQLMVAVRYRYKEGFLYGSVLVVLSKLVAIAYGFMIGSHFLGLALSEIIHQASNFIANTFLVLKDRRKVDLRDLGSAEIRKVLIKYINFPKLELPAVAILVLSSQVPVLWLPAAFGLTAFGQFTLALSLLEMPMRLIGYSLTGTFYQKAADTFTRSGPAAVSSITKRTMRSISAIGAVPLVVILFSAEPVFVFLFGEEWRMTGIIAAQLTPMYAARLLVEPITSVLRVIGEQGTYIWTNLSFLLLRLAIAALAIALDLGLEAAIVMYSWINAIAYLAQGGFILWRLDRATARLSPVDR